MAALHCPAEESTNLPPWLNHPLSLGEAINTALQQNGSILRGKSDLEAQYGVVVQTRAIAIPHVLANGQYEYTSEIEKLTFPQNPNSPVQVSGFQPPHNIWTGDIEVVQSVYSGGQITSSLRSARLTKDQALLQYQTVVADSLLQVRVAYYDVLQSAEQVEVEEASVKLLTEEVDDQQRRFNAGTVPRFNVLQAEVQLANERPRLIHARSAFRIAKNNLSNALGSHLPPQVLEDIPLELTDKLDDSAYDIDLPVAIGKALENRTELASLRKEEKLRNEGVIYAEGNRKPAVQIFGEYGARDPNFVSPDPAFTIRGVTTGVQVSWNIFDGFLTKGKIDQAKALHSGSKVDVDNEVRSIELEVRTDYSSFIEARETLESQKKVQEEAEEALRLSKARNEAGTGTQLDVLTAETSLTQARSTQIQALHDYDVARARLERAMGLNVMQAAK
jgi:outer membrane protein TolC